MRKSAREKSGFTLIEIMMVVFVIAVLLMIAIPNFIHARDRAQLKSCVGNLSMIDTAKIEYSMQSSASTGASIKWSDIVPDYIKEQPSCPAGGVYSIEPVGTNPTCTISGHQL